MSEIDVRVRRLGQAVWREAESGVAQGDTWELAARLGYIVRSNYTITGPSSPLPPPLTGDEFVVGPGWALLSSAGVRLPAELAQTAIRQTFHGLEPDPERGVPQADFVRRLATELEALLSSHNPETAERLRATAMDLGLPDDMGLVVLSVEVKEAGRLSKEDGTWRGMLNVCPTQRDEHSVFPPPRDVAPSLRESEFITATT